MNRKNFVKIKLGDILKLEYGKSLVAQKRVNGSFLVYGSSGVVGTHNEYLVDGPAIIIGRKGSVGEVHYCKINFYPIDTTYYIKTSPQKYDIKYLYYFLKNLNLKRLHSDVGVPGLNRETVHNEVVFFLENLSDQIKISSIIFRYDDLIENNERRIKVLEEMAQRLYTEWFVRFRFPGHEKVKMVDSGTEYGLIPDGWEVKQLTNLTKYLSRGISPTYDDEGDSSVINQKCIRNKRFDLELSRRQRKKIPLEKYILFGDILINSTGVGTLGRVAQVYEKLDNCTVDSHVTIVRPFSENYIDYLGLAVLNQQEVFERLGVGATGQTELSRYAIGEIEFIVPPKELANMFSRNIRPIRNEVIVLQNNIKTIKKMRDLLIPQLITGKMRLK